MKFPPNNSIKIASFICIVLIIVASFITINGGKTSFLPLNSQGKLANKIVEFSVPAIGILFLILLIIALIAQNRYVKQRRMRVHLDTRLDVFKSHFDSLTIEFIPAFGESRLPHTTFGVFRGSSALSNLIQILQDNRQADDFRETNGTECKIFILKSEFLLSEINSFCHYYATLEQNKEKQAKIFSLLSTYVGTFNTLVSTAENYKLNYIYSNENKALSVDPLIELKSKVDHFFRFTSIHPQ